MTSSAQTRLGPLQALVDRLRGPDGCPWDQEQTVDDLRAYVIEEAHEVAAAIDSGDRRALAEELGDLLFQVVFLGQLGAEEGSFTLTDVAEGIHRKMVDRHPHVFGSAPKLEDGAEVAKAWERRKLERSESLLAGVPASLPALTGAYRLTQKAAGVGFDWRSAEPVFAKVREELLELEEATAGAGPDADEQVAEELGDLLFAVANLARHLGCDPEAALAQGNAKFRRRFGEVEAHFKKRGEPLAEAGLDAMDAVWDQVKEREKKKR
ncbi:MAG: nucleoside triphosphate pyrophosphohydrolase [Acidobacteriota bacterium]